MQQAAGSLEGTRHSVVGIAKGHQDLRRQEELARRMAPELEADIADKGYID